jgi:uncharacterized protein (DUF342 family)
MNNAKIDLGEEAFNDCRRLTARISDLERSVKALSEKMNELIKDHNTLKEKFETYLLKQDVETIIKQSENGESR